jgi:hypothetical protein
VARSGIELEVAPEMTILQVLETARQRKWNAYAGKVFAAPVKRELLKGKLTTAISI